MNDTPEERLCRAAWELQRAATAYEEARQAMARAYAAEQSAPDVEECVEDLG